LRVVLAGLLLVSTACSHASPPSAAEHASRRDEWLLALRSDVQRIGAADGFEGTLRVRHGGKPEIEQSFGSTTCLPLGAGRRVLATLAVGALAQAGRLRYGDRVERILPDLARSSLGPLTIENLLTNSAGLARETGVSSPPHRDDDLENRLLAAGKVPLHSAPGTWIDPEDERPWQLVEDVVTQVSGEPFADFVARTVLVPAGLRDTTLRATGACPEASRGVTSLEDQFRLIDALRSGTVISAATRDELWTPRLPTAAGRDMALGFTVRTATTERAVGIGSPVAATAYELWIDPASTDALVLLGRTPTSTGRGIRVALGEFYALPPSAPHGPPPRTGARR